MSDSARIPQLDGLRGIAILAVLGIHTGLLSGGRAGVDIFFALSGYLITGILLREHARTGSINLLNFYRRRAVRLLPALFVFLAAIALWSQFRPLFPVSNLRALEATLFYFANMQIVWLVPNPEQLGPLTHTWSLSIEEQFYAAWPLLMIAGLRLRTSRDMLFGVVSAGAVAILLWRLWLQFHGAAPDRIYFSTDTHSDGLLIGCALALLPQWLDAFLQRFRALLCPVAGWLLLWTVLTPFMRSPESWISISLAAACSAVLIWSVPHSLRLRQALSYPALVWLGLRSYSFYLWHFAVFWAEPFKPLGLPAPLPLFLGIGLSLLLADVSYRWIELPALRANRPHADGLRPSRVQPQHEQAG
ncbi:MAG TPA: acyltransferase [Steroidobacteraceae bacterium]|jgi:peptidoglycan/LPS O-acetylase OafA/YrhL|nr:acyltransferase [Steroidobacteraceae bacterium]